MEAVCPTYLERDRAGEQLWKGLDCCNDPHAVALRCGELSMGFHWFPRGSTVLTGQQLAIGWGDVAGGDSLTPGQQSASQGVRGLSMLPEEAREQDRMASEPRCRGQL